jgi:hypothetical protein
VNGERDRRRRQLGDHVDAFDLIPTPRDAGGKIGLVLMIGGDDLDLLAEHVAAKILNRHLGRFEGIFAAVIRVDARLIVEDADLDTLCRRRNGKQKTACRHGSRQQSRFHICLPQISGPSMIFYNPAAAHIFQISQLVFQISQ